MTEQEIFFKLLQYSNELLENNKDLMNQDPEADLALLKFLVRIEDNLHYAEKDLYIELINNFLDDKITVEDFSFSYTGIYEGISKKLKHMKRDFNNNKDQLLEFLLKPEQSEFGLLLARIYGDCDHYNPDSDSHLADEEELRNHSRILLLEIQLNSAE